MYSRGQDCCFPLEHEMQNAQLNMLKISNTLVFSFIALKKENEGLLGLTRKHT